MLTELCKELNNWFEIKGNDGKPKGRIFGTFTISGGTLKIDGAQDGQYFRICDSVFNDGVHQYPANGLKDETFDGVIWLMAVPQEIIDLSNDIDDWKAKYGDMVRNPLGGESIGDYSYSLASGPSTGTAGGYGVTWQSVFADQLSHWRKVC